MLSKSVSIRNPKNDKLGSAFKILIDFLTIVEESDKYDEIVVDFSQLKFGNPFLILPICAKINAIRHTHTKVTCLPSYNEHVNDYLEKVFFPEGFDGNENRNFSDILLTYQSKTYLPICKIPILSECIQLRSEIISTLENVLLKQLNLTGQIVSVIKYLISEAIDNIVEHSGCKDNGWIMVQNYPLKGFLDVCIVDLGIGIHGSYIETGKYAVESDAHALELAINGKSTKLITETRGYGIDTSRRMLVEGLGGTYFLFSGDSFYVYTPEFNQITDLKKAIFWKGTMLALRIPKKIPAQFNYTTFLE